MMEKAAIIGKIVLICGEQWYQKWDVKSPMPYQNSIISHFPAGTWGRSSFRGGG